MFTTRCHRWPPASAVMIAVAEGDDVEMALLA